MPLSPNLASWLRHQGFDAVHAAGAGLHRAKDVHILEFAKSEHRIIITADLDFPRLLALSGSHDPGLILFRGGDWSDEEVINRLARILENIPHAKLSGGILTIDRNRVRWRKLPI
jgi:predicted nuclease of predicted toxin-antitoxin system